jgi:two-component system, NarL family, nitrate/nitrite response regulator NarL
MNRIVVADDHPLFRSAVCRNLDAAGRVEIVGQACNGIEAVDLCEELEPDLLLVDMAMPHKDGLAVTRELNTWGIRRRSSC